VCKPPQKHIPPVTEISFTEARLFGIKRREVMIVKSDLGNLTFMDYGLDNGEILSELSRQLGVN
jgi:hypothetical protein